MIWILLCRQARNLEPALIVLRVLLFLVIQTVVVQLLRNEFVGRFLNRFAFRPLELCRMLAGIGDHLLQRRQLIIEISALLINEREPAPDIEAIGKFRRRFLKEIGRSLHAFLALLKRYAAGLFARFLIG